MEVGCDHRSSWRRAAPVRAARPAGRRGTRGGGACGSRASCSTGRTPRGRARRPAAGSRAARCHHHPGRLEVVVVVVVVVVVALRLLRPLLPLLLVPRPLLLLQLQVDSTSAALSLRGRAPSLHAAHRAPATAGRAAPRRAAPLPLVRPVVGGGGAPASHRPTPTETVGCRAPRRRSGVLKRTTDPVMYTACTPPTAQPRNSLAHAW